MSSKRAQSAILVTLTTVALLCSAERGNAQYSRHYIDADSLAYAKALALTQLADLGPPYTTFDSILQGDVVVILADLNRGLSGHSRATGPVDGKPAIFIDASHPERAGLISIHEGWHLEALHTSFPPPETTAELITYHCEEVESHCATLAAVNGASNPISCVDKDYLIESMIYDARICLLGPGVSGPIQIGCPGLTGGQINELPCE